MKMYSITSAIKEMQIKSHAKTTSHSQELLKLKATKHHQMLGKQETTETLVLGSWAYKTVSPPEKTPWWFLIKTHTVWASTYTPRYLTKRDVYQKGQYKNACIIAALFRTAKTEDNSNIHQQKNGYTELYLYNEIVHRDKKECTLIHATTRMTQYVERKKSNRKSNTMYFYLYDIYKYTELIYSDNNHNSSCLSVD